MEQKRIAILGATGSIGRSALAVVDQHPERFRVTVLTANQNEEALAELVDRYQPGVAIVAAGAPGGSRRNDRSTQWQVGHDAILECVTDPSVDIVLNAMVGAVGLESTIAALASGKRVALANKESLVCGGPLVLEAARRGGGELVPVDSEHSAILQCLAGCDADEIDRIVITASGGPFRDFEPERLARVTPRDALRHPTWDMGAKITVDSATLANKALEVIEAHFLFGVPYERIQAVVHPQSIIHSMVEFVDGSVLAQVGFPTMELPILYSFTHPERIPYEVRRFDPVAVGTLSFEAVNETHFPAFRLGVDAGIEGGTAPAVFNAANEVAVAAFLSGELSFPGIARAIDAALSEWPGGRIGGLGDVLDADAWARRVTTHWIEGHTLC
jgi:1-deoxy-D-xylulose-5-phosphate reductoisomerase